MTVPMDQALATTGDDQLSGLVERVTFHSTESGFCVLRTKVRGHRDLVTLVGTLAEVHAGEWVEAQGRWVVDAQHGQQFKAERLRTAPPHTIEGMQRYLGSGLVRGIGPAFARRLVHHFKQAVFEVIDTQPDRLQEVSGIGPMRQACITAAWAEQREIRRIMVFLHSHGVGTSRAFRIYRTYGSSAIDTVRQDPYCLARDIRGVGFKTADQVAASLGIDRQSPLRARAGVEYVLQQLSEEGHCGRGRDELVRLAVEILAIPDPIVQAAVDQAIDEQRIVQHRRPDGSALIYLARFEHAERQLTDDLIRLGQGPHPCPSIDIDKAVQWVQRQAGLQFGADQRQALEQATRHKVLVTTGGPGVGKTTLVRAIVKIMQAKGLKVVLAAPTGRAARRLGEVTSLAARTIHRLLEFDPATAGFKHDAEKPLSGDVFIIDETSMVDLLLAHQLVGAVPRHAMLMLVGDVDQLPSVGPGCVLQDIIASGVVPVCRLTHVFRQAAQSAIISTAHRVNQGRLPHYPHGKVESPDASDFYFIQADDSDKVASLLVRLVREAIPGRFGFDPFDDIQVLTPMQRGPLGGRNLNKVLQEALNATGPAVERYGWTFRIGDKVMQTVNNYDKDVFNGDIGRVVKLDETEQELTVRFDRREVSYHFNELDELVLAYATTVHKSQGSEYPAVVIPIHTQHYVLLQRNLLYTAITRSRKLVVMVGSTKALAMAVKRIDSRRRVTLLAERLVAAGRTPI